MRKVITSVLVCCFMMLQVNVLCAQEQEVRVAADSVAVMQQPVQDIEVGKQEWKWSDRPGSFSIMVGAPSVVGIAVTGGVGCFGAHSIRYEYNVLKWCAVGARFQYEGWSDKSVTHRLDLTMCVNFTYVNREKVQVYSGAGLGIAGVVENEQGRIGFAGYLTAVGVRFGSKRTFGFAEVNAGTAATLAVGLCVKI